MTASIYRIDKFAVPDDAKEEFLARVRETHGILKDCPGFVDESVFEQVSGSGTFNVVTIVEWAGRDAAENAVHAVKAARAEQGFDPAAFMSKLGISPDMGFYRTAEGGS